MILTDNAVRKEMENIEKILDKSCRFIKQLNDIISFIEKKEKIYFCNVCDNPFGESSFNSNCPHCKGDVSRKNPLFTLTEYGRELISIFLRDGSRVLEALNKIELNHTVILIRTDLKNEPRFLCALYLLVKFYGQPGLSYGRDIQVYEVFLSNAKGFIFDETKKITDSTAEVNEENMKSIFKTLLTGDELISIPKRCKQLSDSLPARKATALIRKNMSFKINSGKLNPVLDGKVSVSVRFVHGSIDAEALELSVKKIINIHEVMKMSCKIRVVNSISRYNQELTEKAMKGAISKPEKAIVMTPEIFSKVFSPERIKLLQKIYKNNIKNIYQLAKELDKPYEVVFRNIKYLEGIGLIKVDEKDNKKIPHLICDVSIDMFSKEVVA